MKAYNQNQFQVLCNYISIETEIPLDVAGIVCWSAVIYIAAAVRINQPEGSFTVEQQLEALTKAHVSMLSGIAQLANVPLSRMEVADKIAFGEVMKMTGYTGG